MKFYTAYKPIWSTLLPILWRLPHDTRHTLFEILSPGRFRNMQALRRLPPHTKTSLSLFDQYRCLFVHVPKTGGLSIETGLFGIAGINDHRPLWQYELTYNQNEFESYFKFGFVRNPWDRLVSAFYYLQNGSHYISQHDIKWSKNTLGAYKTFKSFVKGWLSEQNIMKSLQEQVWHFAPQYSYLCDPLGHLKLDFIGRYENLQADYEQIRQQLGIGTALPHENQSRKTALPYQEEYDEEMRQIVAKVYQTDIELFGYEY